MGPFQDIRAADRGAGYYFGSAAAISGKTLFIGSQGFAGLAGAVYVFDFNGTEWVQSAELKPTDSAPNEYFGSTLSASGNSVMVGAYGEHAGYIFTNSGNGWVQAAKLQPNLQEGFTDGASVALNGSTAFLGSYTAKGGVAFIFDRVGNSWTMSQKLTSPAGAGTAFADGGAFGGGILAIGEPYDPATSLESVYFYVLSSGLWNEIQSVSQSSYFGDFGLSIALNQNLAVIGAPYTAGLQGTVFIYTNAAN